MTITVIGPLCTDAGLIQFTDEVGAPHPFSMPAANFLSRQRRPIPLLHDHDKSWQIGEVVALERSRSSGILMVGRLEDDFASLLADGEWWFSSGTTVKATGRPLEMGTARINEVSLCRSTANVNTKAVKWSDIDIAVDSGGQPHGMPLFWRSCWDRAHQLMQTHAYRRSDHLDIVDTDTDPAATHKRSAGPTTSKVRLDGVWLSDEQADVALKVFGGAELASDGSLIRR